MLELERRKLEAFADVLLIVRLYNFFLTKAFNVWGITELPDEVLLLLDDRSENVATGNKSSVAMALWLFQDSSPS